MTMPQPQKPQSSFLRIIGGRWRGRKIHFQDEADLRPTPDRVRETLFNWLQGDIVDARCLDLFCGSGALGLEALSRGAAHCDFVETNPTTLSQVKQIIGELKAGNALTHHMPALQFLASRPPATEYDIVFMDPPFRLDVIKPCVELIHRQSLCRDTGVIYIESAEAIAVEQLPGAWQIHRQKKAGNVYYQLITQHI